MNGVSVYGTQNRFRDIRMLTRKNSPTRIQCRLISWRNVIALRQCRHGLEKKQNR